MVAGEDLRGLMRLWPHGVSILSVDVEGDRMGVTVSSLVSLSLERGPSRRALVYRESTYHGL